MRIVVEHLEKCLSPWILCEYRYLIGLFKGSILFTNVRSSSAQRILKALGADATEKSVADLVAEGLLGSVLVLDPKADQALEPDDLRHVEAVVIGGIMGDHPPRGRTYREITSKLLRLTPRCLARNLGKQQLTIAGAGYVLKRIAEGAKLKDLDIRFGLSFTVKVGKYDVTVELPYAFPYEEGVPVLPEGYLDVVARRSLVFESREECMESEGNSR